MISEETILGEEDYPGFEYNQTTLTAGNYLTVLRYSIGDSNFDGIWYLQPL